MQTFIYEKFGESVKLDAHAEHSNMPVATQ